jgi:hypothetical protein
MIIRNQVIAPRRGNKLQAQGIALGNGRRSQRPERAKALTESNAFALSGRKSSALHTQGDALGY